jgi:hypothetical protein
VDQQAVEHCVLFDERVSLQPNSPKIGSLKLSLERNDDDAVIAQ